MRKTTFVVCAALAGAEALAGTNLLKNGHFDDSTFVGSGSYVYASTAGVEIPNWTFSNKGRAVLDAGKFLGGSANRGKYALALQYASTDGEVYAEQAFEIDEPGTHRYSLLYASRYNSSGKGTAFKIILVDPDGVASELETVAVDPAVDGRWLPCCGTVAVARAGTYRFRILVPAPAADGYNQADRSDVFDNVTFARVTDGDLLANGSFDEAVVPSGTNNGNWSYGSGGIQNLQWTVAPADRVALAVRFSTWDKFGVEAGNYMMALQSNNSGDATAEQTFTVPRTGVYLLSFDYGARSSDNNGLPLEAHLVHGGTDMLVARVSIRYGALQTHAVQMRLVETGDYTLRFVFPNQTEDRTALLDAVSFARVGRIAGGNLLLNPGFDEGAISGTSYSYANNARYANPHWTVSPTGRGGLTTQTGTFLGNGPVCNTYALFLQKSSETAADVYAEQAFVVTEPGVYRYSFLYAARNRTNEGTGVDVRLVGPDDVETVLKTVAGDDLPERIRWKPLYGETEIVTPGRYKLRIYVLAPEGYETYDKSDAFDNVFFAKVAEGDLIRNGNFDEGVVPSSANNGSRAYANATGYDNPEWETTPLNRCGLAVSGAAFVPAGLDVGTYALYLQTSHTQAAPPQAEQTFTVAADQLGIYSLTFNYAIRSAGAYFTLGGLPLEVSLVHGGVTRTLANLSVMSMELLTHGVTFDISEAGDYTLRFRVPAAGEGANPDTWDRSVILDAVSLRKIGDGVIAAATWTGAAGDDDPATPGNWSCFHADGTSAPDAVPTPDTVVTIGGSIGWDLADGAPEHRALVFAEGAKISGTRDWRGLTDMSGVTGTLDLDGNTLHLSTANGEFTVTNSNSDAEHPAEIRLHVATGRKAGGIAAISGNVRVVKEGGGTFVSGRSQSYSGGTLVREGTVQPPDGTGTDSVYCYDIFKSFGLGFIRVETNAVFDLRANYAYRSHIDLAGGILRQSGDDMTKLNYGGSAVGTLFADSFLDAAGTLVFGAVDESDVNLGGYTLTATVASGKYIYTRPAYVTNGTFAVSGGGTLCVLSELDMRTATLEAGCALVLSNALHVTDYVANYAGSGNGGTGAMNVYGRFVPNADGFYGCTMQDGSAIDLSGRADALPLNGLKFAAGAQVAVTLGDRAVQDGTRLISWTAETRPGGVRFVPGDPGAWYSLSARADGLYVGSSGTVILFR